MTEVDSREAMCCSHQDAIIDQASTTMMSPLLLWIVVNFQRSLCRLSDKLFYWFYNDWNQVIDDVLCDDCRRKNFDSSKNRFFFSPVCRTESTFGSDVRTEISVNRTPLLSENFSIFMFVSAHVRGKKICRFDPHLTICLSRLSDST